MSQPLSDAALDQIFRTARTRNGWSPEPVSETMLRAVYDLAKMGPTATNCCPARFVFVVAPEAKARLAPHLSAGNRPKVMAAPATVIIGYDLDFASRIPELFPHNPGAKDWFANPDVARETAFRNGSLQGAYLMLAARSLGLDCGPMSGFNQAGVNAEFFSGTSVLANFICNIGHGTDEYLFPRSPRLAFEDACTVL